MACFGGMVCSAWRTYLVLVLMFLHIFLPETKILKSTFLVYVSKLHRYFMQILHIFSSFFEDDDVVIRPEYKVLTDDVNYLTIYWSNNI